MVENSLQVVYHSAGCKPSKNQKITWLTSYCRSSLAPSRCTILLWQSSKLKKGKIKFGLRGSIFQFPTVCSRAGPDSDALDPQRIYGTNPLPFVSTFNVQAKMKCPTVQPQLALRIPPPPKLVFKFSLCTI